MIGADVGPGLLYAIANANSDLAAARQQVATLVEEKTVLAEQVQKLHEHIATLTRERDGLLHQADKAPEPPTGRTCAEAHPHHDISCVLKDQH